MFLIYMLFIPNCSQSVHHGWRTRHIRGDPTPHLFRHPKFKFPSQISLPNFECLFPRGQVQLVDANGFNVTRSRPDAQLTCMPCGLVDDI